MTQFKERTACPGADILPAEMLTEADSPTGDTVPGICPECEQAFWVTEDGPIPPHASLADVGFFTTRKTPVSGRQEIRPKPVRMTAAAKNAGV